MILKFNDFLTEKLSYSEDVDIISKNIIKYLYDKESWESLEIIKIDNPVIKEVRIQFIDNLSKLGKKSSFNPNKSDYNDRMIFLEFDPVYITEGLLNHEIFHGWEWLQKGGKNLTNSFQFAIIQLDNYFKDDENISEIIHLFYLMSDAEIRSHFNSDIFEFKKWKDGKNILSDEEIDSLIEETDIFENYQFVKKFNLNGYLNKLSSDKLDEFISAVEQIEFMEDGEESEIMIKKFSDSEKGKFIQKLNTIHKQQSEKISKYLGKLIIHFRNS
jgi:hypothetical protein